MDQKIYPYVYFNGSIQKKNEARVSLASTSLQYGITCFSGLRGYHRDGKLFVFRLKDHCERLINATRMLGMEIKLTEAEIFQALKTTLDANAISEDVYIRPFVFTQNESISPRPKGLSFELGIYILQMDHYFDPTKGLKLMISSWRKFSDAALPTKAKAGGCYVNSFLAAGEADRHGYDDALIMDHSGSIVEASVANILISYRGRIISPPIADARLDGITIRSAIELLKARGIAVSFEKIDRSMIYSCDELLLTGTAAQIMYAESVDGKKIEKGPLHEMLFKDFQQVIDGKHIFSNEWLTCLKEDKK